MRRAVGWLLLLLGLTAALLGATAAVVFGPDDRVSTGPHRLSSTGTAIATAPSVLRYAGPRLEITVTSRDPRCTVFVGVGSDVDVTDYLTAVEHSRVDAVELPWRARTTAVRGEPAPGAPPAGLDWWLVRREGRGGATVAFRLPDAEVDVVAMDSRLTPRFAADVTVTWIQHGAFLGAVALGVGGVGASVAGWLLRSRPRSAASRSA